MTHQRGHAALVAFSVTDHLLDLRTLLFTLGEVGFAPMALAAADVLGEVQHGATVNPQFFESFVEDVRIHAQLLL